MEAEAGVTSFEGEEGALSQGMQVAPKPCRKNRLCPYLGFSASKLTLTSGTLRE